MTAHIPKEEKLRNRAWCHGLSFPDYDGSRGHHCVWVSATCNMKNAHSSSGCTQFRVAHCGQLTEWGWHAPRDTPAMQKSLGRVAVKFIERGTLITTTVLVTNLKTEQQEEWGHVRQ